MGTLWQDIRYGFRKLRNSPGFALVVVLTLALGIGANAAVFSFLDRMLLRPLPVKKPHELVLLKGRCGTYTEGSFVYPVYLELRRQSEELFSGFMAYSRIKADLGIGGSVREVMGIAVSSDYFSVLGVKTAVGRGFLAEEDRSPGSHPVAVISHELWQRQFDGDPSIVGQTIQLDKYPLTVVGVAPAGFHGTFAGLSPTVYVPISMWAYIKDISLEKYVYDWMHLLARTKPGVSREQAQAALTVVAQRIHALEPDNTPTQILVTDGSRGTDFWTGEFLWLPVVLLQFLTMLILVVACSNVANLLLARGTTRQTEIAIRRAIGAEHARIVRQLLVESALLALLSGLCSTLLAHWFSIALDNALPDSSVIDIPAGVDGRVFIFTLLISFVSVLFFGLVPALRISRCQPMVVLKEGAGSLGAGGRRWGLQNFLVAGQVAVSVIVLVFGALCVRSLGKLRFVDPGFDSAKVLAVSIDYERGPVGASEAEQFCTDLKERVAAYPGVQSVSLTTRVPLSGGGRNRTTADHIEGYQIPPDKEYVSWEFFGEAGPGYFKTLGVPLLQGREFSLRDGPGAPDVIIVNELVAQRYWPNQNPIGKHVTLSNGDVREVVGVTKATRLYTLAEEPRLISYSPIAQSKQAKPDLLIRLAGDPKTTAALVRNELDTMGLNPSVYHVRTVAEQAWDELFLQRMIAGILNVVGSFGLLFVATGIFSVMAYEVSRRRREIGLRVALGAQWFDVRSLILRKGAFLTGTGLVIGVGLSFVPLFILAHLIPEINGWLYGVRLWDPLTYVGMALLIVLIALMACWLPARRAAKVDPMVALRYE
ncbi:MAG: ABC transporter permease [Planctomycetota bacterium]|jgi:predicted permease